ncbi:hypothetical protein Hanom_Chr10g00943201 [Helianthus anomalus]
MNQLNLSDVTWLIVMENLRIIEICSAAFDRRMREQQPFCKYGKSSDQQQGEDCNLQGGHLCKYIGAPTFVFKSYIIMKIK